MNREYFLTEFKPNRRYIVENSPVTKVDGYLTLKFAPCETIQAAKQNPKERFSPPNDFPLFDALLKTLFFQQFNRKSKYFCREMIFSRTAVRVLKINAKFRYLKLLTISRQNRQTKIPALNVAAAQRH